MWPSAVVLSSWLVTEPSLLCHDDGTALSVLELGAGCGLTGLVAARLQQQLLQHKRHQPLSAVGKEYVQLPVEVTLTDFNLTVQENLIHNLAVNDMTDVCSVIGLDFYQQMGVSNNWKDMNGVLRKQVNVILAADIICQPSDAVATAKTIRDVLMPGGSAYIVCADAAHRFGVDHFAAECKGVGLEVNIKEVREVCNGALLGMNLEQTAGYVEGMNLTLFMIRKAH